MKDNILNTLSFILVLCFGNKAQCLSFDIKVLSFELALLNSDNKTSSVIMRTEAEANNTANDTAKAASELNRKKRDHSDDDDADCQYQYPKEKQVEFILSNMMNELTLVFVKANGWVKEKIYRKSNMLPNAEDIRRALDTRFNVTHERRKAFFEDIYFNMIRNYKKFYNRTTERVFRAGNNASACKHQGEVRALWHALLERSLATLERAARRCVTDYLVEHKIPPGSEFGHRVKQYLMDEMSEIQLSLLKPLCDKYNMCYDAVLKQFQPMTNPKEQIDIQKNSDFNLALLK